MDATKKPLLIPPEFSTYAEKHGIFQIYEGILKKLLIHQPDDPLQIIIDWLKEPDNVPQIFVLGPPGVGKRSISRETSDKINCAYISKDDFDADLKSDEDIVDEIQKRIESSECIEKGWLLEGFPQNRKQALGFQAAGIFPKHVVLLDAPDTVLVERVMGKRIDTLTGDVYHATFHPVTSPDVIKRVKSDPNSSEPIMLKRLLEYHRNISGVLRCYENIYKTVNADQPKEDVFTQTLSYLSMKQRNNAPHTPRVLLLGPTGSGKSVHAALLASKYKLINVNLPEHINQLLCNESELGEAMKPYVERGVRVPDEMIIKALSEKLGQLDAVKQGWVLHGFPTSRTQVDAFSCAGYEPNRVIVLDVSSETAVERLNLCCIDPKTGHRYHLLYNPPRTSDIKSRLQTHPDDEEGEVLKRYADYQVNIEDVLEYYSKAQHVNADQDIQSVFESVETIIVNPLPDKIE